MTYNPVTQRITPPYKSYILTQRQGDANQYSITSNIVHILLGIGKLYQVQKYVTLIFLAL